MAAALDRTDPRAQALRAFNRFYTRRIGALGPRLPGSRFTLPELRLLRELAHQPGQTASALKRELQLDAGYLSRLLAGLRQRGLVGAQRAPQDGRQTLLSLTAAGRRAWAPLDRRSHEQARALLARLPDAHQDELVAAAQRMQALLGDHGAAAAPAAAVTLRPLVPGDLGWVVGRHGALYAQEHGWDWRFEALVARVVADFVDQLQPGLEAAWIAQRNGLPLGCVFVVQARHEATRDVDAGIAQLRLLLVEPAARGQGVGKLLGNQCEAFARGAGYTRIRLWTNSLLLAARGMYAAAGYRLVASAPHHSFGHDLVGEVWEKHLDPMRGAGSVLAAAA